MTPAIETVEALDEMRASVVSLGHTRAYISPDEALMLVRAIRQADERAGLVTVNRQLTHAMAAALEDTDMGDMSDRLEGEWQPIWEAALAASPFASAAQGEGGE